jgi:hypothetical protein
METARVVSRPSMREIDSVDIARRYFHSMKIAFLPGDEYEKQTRFNQMLLVSRVRKDLTHFFWRNKINLGKFNIDQKTR